jgi:hypothetical protein
MIAKTAHRKSVAAWLMSMFATVGFTPMEPPTSTSGADMLGETRRGGRMKGADSVRDVVHILAAAREKARTPFQSA